MEFWFEFASTYTYPVVMTIEARAMDRELRWCPFLLGPIFRTQGWLDSPFNLFPVKGRYMWRDLQRLCDDAGLPFRRPTEFPRNGLTAARIAARFAGEDWIPSFVRAVFSANFAEDRDISHPDVLLDCLPPHSAREIFAEANSPEAKAHLRNETARAQELGIFGSPSFVVDGELFWGGDRLTAALEWAEP